MATTWTSAELLARPVRLRGITLGRPVDLLVDTAAHRLIGFEVRCGDGAVRFLPLAAARIRSKEIEVRSALLLLDERDTSFYRRRTRPFRELRGVPVGRDGAVLGPLAELVVSEDGNVAALRIDGGRSVALDASISLDDRASAA